MGWTWPAVACSSGVRTTSDAVMAALMCAFVASMANSVQVTIILVAGYQCVTKSICTERWPTAGSYMVFAGSQTFACPCWVMKTH
jgi:hypothetical protein